MWATRRWMEMENRFVMMEGYFDESGIHDGAKVCIVAGYYGGQAAWRKFENEWNAILSEYSGLADYGFHAKEFFGRNGEKRVGKYKGWSDEQARTFLNRLVQAIVRNRIFPIGYGVVVEDFLALPLVSRQWLTGAKFRKSDGKVVTSGCPSKSYYLPFNFCMLKSAKLSNANSVDKIHFFVGLDRSFHEYASDLYKHTLVDDRLEESHRDLLGTIAYPLSKDTPGIQAADLLAYRLYRGAKDALSNPNYAPSPLMLKLLKNWKGTLSFRLMNSVLFAQMETEGKAAYERMMKGG
jgi:hypothetical protein